MALPTEAMMADPEFMKAWLDACNGRDVMRAIRDGVWDPNDWECTQHFVTTTSADDAE